jgi:hypothetical protein
MMQLADFYNYHKGQTALLVGLGPNLKRTPPEWFDYPSFGVNTIFDYSGFKAGWRPTYYAGVDERLYLEYFDRITRDLADIPKFVPSPDRDKWKGENFYRFQHRPGEMIMGGRLANHPQALTQLGIGYVNVMTAVMQIAWHMGFTTLLMIGIQHNPKNLREHVWGLDERMPKSQTAEHWIQGYGQLVRCMNGIRILNISEDTYVSEQVIPRDDWRKWANVKERVVL